MKDQLQSQLASVLTFVVGGWLMLSPAFISADGTAVVNVLVVGAIVALAGLAQLFWTSTVPSWISALAAGWLLISTFIFNASTGFVWSVIISAIVAFVAAIWDGVEVNHLQHSRHNSMQS